MAYLTPKTDWTSVDGVLSTDLNRIEGNIETLATLRGYPTATGTGTAIAVTTGYFELVAGRSLTFIASANNSGAATTLNADGTGAKNLYKPNTTDAPTIISGKAYTVWYNGTSFFVKASAEGDAVAGDVIKDKTFSNDEDTGITGTLELTGNAAVGDVLATKTFYNTDPKTKRTGTMPNRGTVSTDISAKATEVTIAQGYHSGSGKVKISATEQAKILPENIKEDVSILGVTGTLGKFEAGDYLLVISSEDRFLSDTSYTKVKEFLIKKTGTYRVSFELSTNDYTGESWAYGRIYKNGTAIGTERSRNLTSYVTFTEDFAFTVGDYCQLYLASSSSKYARAKNLKLGISFDYFASLPT